MNLNQKEHIYIYIYIYIYKSENEITIKQDFIGAYGLYLYKDEEYFAISNSFIYLVDYIKKQKSHKITFNKEYADAFIVADLCSFAYSETMVNEIRLIDRSTVITININDKKFKISYIDYKENTIDIDSFEGIKLLDKWYYKWTNILQNLKVKTNNIMADLSGGFDSRMVFALLLGSKINLNEILINSIHDNKHTHTEDYEIANKIAQYFKFTLNNKTNIKGKYFNYNIKDVLNISFYLKVGFHKQMFWKYSFMFPKRYYLGGAGGECIRNYWNLSEEEFIKQQIKRSYTYSKDNVERFIKSLCKVAEKSFEEIDNKFKAFDRSIKDEDKTLNLYRETRCRNHFGKEMVENFFAGCIRLCPLIDSDLHKLKLTTFECNDKNLLMALIFVRYGKELLNFKFEGKRFIDKKTIQYATTLSKKYALNTIYNEEKLNLIDFTTEKSMDNINSYNNITNINEKVYEKDINKTLMNAFNSITTKNNFKLYYSEPLIAYFVNDIKQRTYHPLQSAYVVISISKIVQDILINENINEKTFADFVMNQQICQDGLTFNESYLRYSKYIDAYVTARIDIKNTKSTFLKENDIEILNISDKAANIETPAWFKNNGKGYVIESEKGFLNIVFKCINSGKLVINLRGSDIRNKNNERIPIWIDYCKFFVNEKNVFDKVIPVCHDKAFNFTKEVNDGEIISLLIEWLPHDLKNN